MSDQDVWDQDASLSSQESLSLGSDSFGDDSSRASSFASKKHSRPQEDTSNEQNVTDMYERLNAQSVTDDQGSSSQRSSLVPTLRNMGQQKGMGMIGEESADSVLTQKQNTSGDSHAVAGHSSSSVVLGGRSESGSTHLLSMTIQDQAEDHHQSHAFSSQRPKLAPHAMYMQQYQQHKYPFKYPPPESVQGETDQSYIQPGKNVDSSAAIRTDNGLEVYDDLVDTTLARYSMKTTVKTNFGKQDESSNIVGWDQYTSLPSRQVRSNKSARTTAHANVANDNTSVEGIGGIDINRYIDSIATKQSISLQKHAVKYQCTASYDKEKAPQGDKSEVSTPLNIDHAITDGFDVALAETQDSSGYSRYQPQCEDLYITQGTQAQTESDRSLEKVKYLSDMDAFYAAIGAPGFDLFLQHERKGKKKAVKMQNSTSYQEVVDVRDGNRNMNKSHDDALPCEENVRANANNNNNNMNSNNYSESPQKQSQQPHNRARTPQQQDRVSTPSSPPTLPPPQPPSHHNHNHQQIPRGTPVIAKSVSRRGSKVGMTTSGENKVSAVSVQPSRPCSAVVKGHSAVRSRPGSTVKPSSRPASAMKSSSRPPSATSTRNSLPRDDASVVMSVQSERTSSNSNGNVPQSFSTKHSKSSSLLPVETEKALHTVEYETEPQFYQPKYTPRTSPSHKPIPIRNSSPVVRPTPTPVVIPPASQPHHTDQIDTDSEDIEADEQQPTSRPQYGFPAHYAHGGAPLNVNREATKYVCDEGDHNVQSNDSHSTNIQLFTSLQNHGVAPLALGSNGSKQHANHSKQQHNARIQHMYPPPAKPVKLSESRLGQQSQSQPTDIVPERRPVVRPVSADAHFLHKNERKPSRALQKIIDAETAIKTKREEREKKSNPSAFLEKVEKHAKDQKKIRMQEKEKKQQEEKLRNEVKFREPTNSFTSVLQTWQREWRERGEVRARKRAADKPTFTPAIDSKYVPKETLEVRLQQQIEAHNRRNETIDERRAQLYAEKQWNFSPQQEQSSKSEFQEKYSQALGVVDR